MRYLRIERFLWILLPFSAIVWFIRAAVSSDGLSGAWPFFALFPDVVTADIVLAWLFINWFWKWRLFRGWLVPFPDLNGTWVGTIDTTWVNEKTGKAPGPISVMLVINQSFVQVSCVMRTSEMTSFSYSSDFILDSDSTVRRLIYSYGSNPRPKVADRSERHEGTIVFEIIGDPPKELQGEYWTSRKTTGEIFLQFKTNKKLGELPMNTPPHPVSATD